MKFYEGLIANGQPFLGEILENEGKILHVANRNIEKTIVYLRTICFYLDKRASDLSNEPVERPLIDDDLLKKCPAIEKLRPDMREKLKNYLQEQVSSVTHNNQQISFVESDCF